VFAEVRVVTLLIANTRRTRVVSIATATASCTAVTASTRRVNVARHRAVNRCI